jgi:hypothetical protein
MNVKTRFQNWNLTIQPLCFGREFQAIGFEKTYSNKDDIEKRNNNDEDEPSEDIDIQKMEEDVILKTQKHLPLLW